MLWPSQGVSSTLHAGSECNVLFFLLFIFNLLTEPLSLFSILLILFFFAYISLLRAYGVPSDVKASQDGVVHCHGEVRHGLHVHHLRIRVLNFDFFF